MEFERTTDEDEDEAESTTPRRYSYFYIHGIYTIAHE